MKKYVIILISLAAVCLLVSSATAVPQVQSQSNLKRLKKSEEVQQIIIDRAKIIEELKNDNQLLKNDYKEIEELLRINLLDNGMLGPFLDWLINLINQIINIIQNLIDLISDILSLANLITLLIEKINQLISLVQEFIQWIIDLFNPNTNII